MYERNSRHRETILDNSLFDGCSKDACSSAQYLSGRVVSQHHFAKKNEGPPSTFYVRDGEGHCHARKKGRTGRNVPSDRPSPSSSTRQSPKNYVSPPASGLWALSLTSGIQCGMPPRGLDG